MISKILFAGWAVTGFAASSSAETINHSQIYICTPSLTQFTCHNEQGDLLFARSSKGKLLAHNEQGELYVCDWMSGWKFSCVQTKN